MKKLLLLSLFVLVTAAAGCRPPAGETNANSAAAPKTSPAPSKGVSVEIKTEPEFVESNKDVRLSFYLKNEGGEPVKDLKIVHEKPMHLLVVSDDLAEFYHLHPEPATDGGYHLTTKFTNGGAYKLYLDFTLPDGTAKIEKLGLGVAGLLRPKQELKADAALAKTVESLRVEMKPGGELKAKSDVMLNFTVNDAATGKPVVDLENYLGELAHFVIISEDTEDFVHAHPMAGGGAKESGNGHTHDAGAKHETAAAATISAHVSFPRGGLYKVWAQFQRGGKVITVPFVASVKAAEGETNLGDIAVPADAIKITVSKDGFKPNAVEIKKGGPQKLAFVRIDTQNCGTEVVFKGIDIKKYLPLGEVVIVEIPANAPKEISFACGMEMYKGQVLIE